MLILGAVIIVFAVVAEVIGSLFAPTHTGGTGTQGYCPDGLCTPSRKVRTALTEKEQAVWDEWVRQTTQQAYDNLEPVVSTRHVQEERRETVQEPLIPEQWKINARAEYARRQKEAAYAEKVGQIVENKTAQLKQEAKTDFFNRRKQ